MNIHTSKRMNDFQVGIFSELSQYQTSKLSQGYDMIDLSIGSPDLPPPQFIIDELGELVKDQSQYGYSLTGTLEFHDAVAKFYHEKYRVKLDSKNEILTLMGSQDGLVHLPFVFADEGDIILVPDPGYTAYNAGLSLAKAQPYPMPLRKENDFLPDLTEIPQSVAEKAKMMILNFPGNPVPALANEDFFKEVVGFAKRFNIIVVHDFAYSELYFNQQKPISFLSIPGAIEVGVEFNSLSKSFNMAGCRIGFICGNEHVINALGRLKSNLDYGVFFPIQKVAAKALLTTSSFSDHNRELYKRRRDILVDGLHSAGWIVDKPDATMFIWAAVPSGWTSIDFAYKLIDRAGVVVTPGSAFGVHGEGYVRIALVQSEDRLQKAVTNIKESGIFST